jgi:hypothetical protein
VWHCDNDTRAAWERREEATVTNRAAYDVEVGEMSEQDAAEVFDGIARRELGISGREFLDRWDAGEYRSTDRDDLDGLSEVVAGMSLVR